MTMVTRSVDFAIKLRERKKQPAADSGRVPRISKLMALAIRYDQMLNEGVVKSQTELAELLHISQPRMTQIMNLLHLSPEIQEEILMLVELTPGSAMNEHHLRKITSSICWKEQVKNWSRVNST